MDLTEIRDHELPRSLESLLLVCGPQHGVVDGDTLVANEAEKGCIQHVAPP